MFEIKTLSRYAAMVAVLTLTLAGCGSKETAREERSTGKGDGKMETDAPGKRSVEDLIQGEWAPDYEHMISLMEREAEISEVRKEQMAKVMSLTVYELRDGFATIHIPGPAPKEAYEIISADEATGDFEVRMGAAVGSQNIGKGNVQEDSMTMTNEGVTMKLFRLSEAEFQKRLKLIKEFSAERGG